MLFLLSALAYAALPAAPPAKAEIAGTVPAINILCWPSGLQVGRTHGREVTDG